MPITAYSTPRATYPARASASNSGVSVKASAFSFGDVDSHAPAASPAWRELHLGRRTAGRALGRAAPRRLRSGLLQGLGEGQTAAAERHGAEGEPRPAEHDARDHVREPVHIEQDAARCDRRPRSLRRCPRAALARARPVAARGSMQARRRTRPPSRSGRWERRAERLGDGVERRPRAIDQGLDAIRDGLVARVDEQQEGERRATRGALRS